MKSLASTVSKVAAPVLGKRGFGEAELILEWQTIIGEELARSTLPLKLSFAKGERTDGTLNLRVVSAAAPEIRHLEPQIIDRINTFFGYKAVGRLKLTQGPMPNPPVRRAKPPRPLDRAETQALEHSLEGIADPELRAVLERWGEAVIGSTDPAPMRPGRGRPRS
jgi:hypothetical protein